MAVGGGEGGGREGEPARGRWEAGGWGWTCAAQLVWGLQLLSHRACPHACPALVPLQDGEYCRGEVFYFDYGCLAFWGLSERQEREVMRSLVAPCLVDALPASEVEVDEFQFHYSLNEKPHIQNDTITSE